MAKELEHFDSTGLTIYAKPLPLSSSPSWSADAIDLTEVNGYYTADVTSPAYPYAVFTQAGGSKASTDSCRGIVDASVASRSSHTASQVRVEMDANSTRLSDIADTSSVAAAQSTTAASQATSANDILSHATYGNAAIRTLVSSTNTRVLLALPAVAPNATGGLLVVGGTGMTTVVQISPLLAISNQPAWAKKDIEVAQHSANPYRWLIKDATGANVDLTSKTVRFIVGTEGDDGFTAEFAYTSGTDSEITKGDGYVQVTPDPDDLADVAEYAYWVWNITDDVLLVEGRWKVTSTLKEIA